MSARRVSTGVLRPSSSATRTHYGVVSLAGVEGHSLFGPRGFSYTPRRTFSGTFYPLPR